MNLISELGIGAMTTAQAARIINDPRGPEEVIPSLPSTQLARLLDALYRDLDRAAPDPGAELWYRLCVEESNGRQNTAPATGR